MTPTDSPTSNSQDLPDILEALSTGRATFYNHVKQGQDEGRLILTKHRLAWYPEDQELESSAGIKISWDKVIKYHVSSVFDEEPTVTVMSRKQQSFPFVLSSKSDMERLKLDLKQRLNGKKKKNKHSQEEAPSHVQSPNIANRFHIPIQHEVPREGEPETVMIIYKTKTGSEISYTSLKVDNTKADDADATSSEPKMTSTNLNPQETVEFIKTMISARNEATDTILVDEQPSAIVIATVYKSLDTRLGLVLGHKENQQLCIVSMTPNSLLRNTPLCEGMEVISINNTDCRTLDSPSAARLVKSSEGKLTIIARQPLPSVSSSPSSAEA